MRAVQSWLICNIYGRYGRGGWALAGEVVAICSHQHRQPLKQPCSTSPQPAPASPLGLLIRQPHRPPPSAVQHRPAPSWPGRRWTGALGGFWGSRPACPLSRHEGAGRVWRALPAGNSPPCFNVWINTKSKPPSNTAEPARAPGRRMGLRQYPRAPSRESRRCPSSPSTQPHSVHAPLGRATNAHPAMDVAEHQAS